MIKTIQLLIVKHVVIFVNNVLLEILVQSASKIRIENMIQCFKLVNVNLDLLKI